MIWRRWWSAAVLVLLLLLLIVPPRRRGWVVSRRNVPTTLPPVHEVYGVFNPWEHARGPSEEYGFWRPWEEPEPVHIAVCAASKSKPSWRSLADTALSTLLIPSLNRTTLGEPYIFTLYLAFDRDDSFWQKHVGKLRGGEIPIKHDFYTSPAHKIPFNELTAHAYNDGADYIVRINDDTEFVTEGWATLGVKALAGFEPPNVGVVGPTFKEGNTAILTHDMVHRTHLNIFKYYYPPVFSAWWIDDWITHVYEPGRMKKLSTWHVAHHVTKHGTRYAVQHHESKHLKAEIERGRKVLREWVNVRVVSYSLYGSDARYTSGIIQNAQLMPTIYPRWKMRVYFGKDVPETILNDLRQYEHVELVAGDPALSPMVWRFLVASDPLVERYIIRDADSRISKRESSAVAEWIDSGKRFHVIRDHPSHSNFAMSGGLWGGTKLAFPQMKDLLGSVGTAYVADMNFLTRKVWPVAKHSVFQHDAFGCHYDKWGETRSFPMTRVGWEHVGSVWINGKMRQGDVDLLKDALGRECNREDSASILYVVATNSKTYADRVPHILDTWAKSVVAPDRIVLSVDRQLSISGVPQWKANLANDDGGYDAGRDRKMHVITNIPLRPNEWLMLMDDDAFAITFSLKELVGTLDPKKSAAYGQVQCRGNLCGGAGILFSPALMQNLRQRQPDYQRGTPDDQFISNFIRSNKLGSLVHHEGFRSQAPSHYVLHPDDPGGPLPQNPITFHYVDAMHQRRWKDNYKCGKCGELYHALYRKYYHNALSYGDNRQGGDSMITNKRYISMCDAGFKTRSRDNLRLPLPPNAIVCARGDRAVLEEFFKLNIKTPFTLVTIESDEAVPQNLDWLKHPYLARWYGWNSVHPGVQPIPIGLNHDTQLLPMVNALPAIEKTNKLLVNFRRDREERTALHKKTVGLNWTHVEPYSEKWNSVDQLTRHYESTSRFRWTLCPRGAGQDTHRVWEALYLGSIPVVLKSNLSPLYDGLPVIQLDSWDELSLETLERRTLSTVRNNAYFEHWRGVIQAPIGLRCVLPTATPNNDLVKGVSGSPEELLLAQLKPYIDLDNRVAVDIGGNQGAFSQLIAKVFGKPPTYIFEVISRFRNKLKIDFPASTVEHLAVTDGSAAKVDIKGSSDWTSQFNTGASILTRASNYDTVLESVNAIKMDAYFENKPDIHFLKVDTEGMDGRVLRGAEKMLRFKRIQCIFWESNRMQASIGDSLYKNIQFLNSVGYTSFAVGHGVIFPISTCAEHERVFEQNRATGNILSVVAGSPLWNALVQAHGFKAVPTSVVKFSTRDDFGRVLNAEDNFKVGVELGVQRGHFAEATLSKWHSCTKYVLVDLWAEQTNYNDMANHVNHASFMREAMRRTAPFKRNGVDIEVCKNYTSWCVGKYADGTFDYIYVDARHDFKGSYVDITEWWPKLRVGGIMAGHDYVTQNQGPAQTGQDWTLNFDGTVDATGTVVKGAVNKFALENGFKVNTGSGEQQSWPRKGPWPSWAIRKTSAYHKVDLEYLGKQSATTVASHCIVILTDNKYSLWAEAFLSNLKHVGKVDTKIFCLDPGLSVESKQALEGLCTLVMVPKLQVVHYAKLQIFTSPVFRRFASVVYFDVDHMVTAPVRLPRTPFKKPVLLASKGCKSLTGRHREFNRGVSPLVDSLPTTQFDKDGRCFSTRIMAVDVAALPSIDEMQKRIDVLTQNGVQKASKFWEQGFIQALFWDTSAPFDTEFPSLSHLYHTGCTKQDGKGRCIPVQNAKVPYPVTKTKWGSKCNTTGSLALRTKWRVVLSSDTNPNYLAFLPSAVDHWKSHGVEPVVALVVGTDENVDALVTSIQAFVEVRILRLEKDPRLPKGHAAKLARGYLATQFGDDVVTIVDIDYYLIRFEEWAAHLACVPENGVLGLGYNRYSGTQDEGKFPMYLTTARSSTFARFLKPQPRFQTWVATFQQARVFDNKESPYGTYGSFSDESLFRVLLSQTPVPVVWIDTPTTWKRIDRSERHPVTLRELSSASDVFPNRPLGDCSTYTTRLRPVHRALKIENPQRDTEFLESMTKLQMRDWGESKYRAVASLKGC